MPLFSDAAPRFGTSLLALAPGQTFMPPIGWYWFNSRYGIAEAQRYDGAGGLWRYAGDNGAQNDLFYSDGKTTRLANTTGCAVAAVVTTASSGYTTPPTVTASAGSSTWVAVVGGAINTSVTINSAGTAFVYPPLLIFEGPPYPGVRAAGYTTIANGTISAVTITEAGAGYLRAPAITVVPDWRDTTGYGGQLTAAVAGAGTITAVLCTDHGNPITSGTVPTLSFSTGSAAATTIMDWGVVSCSITTAGAGYTSAAGAVLVTGAGGVVTTAPGTTGADTAGQFTRWRRAAVSLTTSSAGGLSALGQIIDPGRYQSVPSVAMDAAAAAPSTTGVFNFVMGGVATVVYLHPAQN